MVLSERFQNYMFGVGCDWIRFCFIFAIGNDNVTLTNRKPAGGVKFADRAPQRDSKMKDFRLLAIILL